MNLFDSFAAALPLAQFLDRYGSAGDKARWEGAKAAITLSDAQKQLLAQFSRETNVLVLAGAWCGDCVSQCPAFDRFAEAALVLRVRYLDRDDHPQVQQALKINGGDRVPVAVFFSEDGFEIARYGERTLARYRQLAGQPAAGEGCATGLGLGKDPVQALVVQEWLDQFERVQWILRLSPRLRRKYGD